MNCVGVSDLSLNIGGYESTHPFKIIRDMFPKLIVGIRLMKEIDATIEPAKEAIRIHNNYIPFISRVECEKLGNVQALPQRVGW